MIDLEAAKPATEAPVDEAAQARVDALRESANEVIKKASDAEMTTVVVTMAWGQPFLFNDAMGLYNELFKHIRSGKRTAVEIGSDDGKIVLVTEHIAMLQRSTLDIMKSKAAEAKARQDILDALRGGQPQR